MKVTRVFMGIVATQLTLLSLHLQAQNPGDSFFGASQIHIIDITFSQAGYWDSLVYYKEQGDISGSYTYMKAEVIIDGTTITNTGVRLKGNSSYNSHPGNKKPIKLKFNEFVSGQKFDQLKKINLNNAFKDPTFMREKITLDFFRNVGLMAPRCTYTNVYINGTHWGFYTVVEQVDNVFLKTHFGENNGNLFKGDPKGTLEWKGNLESDYYNDYELKTNELLNDWSGLVNFIDKINNTPSASFQDSIDQAFSSATYLKAWAVNNLFVNLDSYVGSGHNYYIYADAAKRFNWITWDVNESFGNFSMGAMSISQREALDIFYIPTPQSQRPLNVNMLANNAYKTQYTDYHYQLISNEFSSSGLYPKIDSIANAIRTDVYADNNKMYSNQNFEDNIENDIDLGMGPGGGWIPGLKSFLDNRRTSVYNQLMGLGYAPLITAELEDEKPIEIKTTPNPFSDWAYIKFNNYENAEAPSFYIHDITGKKIKQLEGGSKLQSTRITSEGLNAGIYFLKVITTDGKIAFGKFIVQ